MDNKSKSFWEATYRQYIAKMIGVCCRYTGDRQTAEDLAHDAFIVAITKVSSFENKGPFEAWLRRIAVNVALQYLRKQKKQENWVAATETVLSDNCQEEHAICEFDRYSGADVLEVIGLLPEHYRLVFNLYAVDNYTHAEIAARLHISEGTSKSHFSRARKKIRELLLAKSGSNRKRKIMLPFFTLVYDKWYTERQFVRMLRNLEFEPVKKLEHTVFEVESSFVPKNGFPGMSVPGSV